MKSLIQKIRTDWLSENIIKTLPIFIAINLVALVVWQLQLSHIAMALVLGVIAGGLVDLDSSLVGKLKNLALSLVAFTLSTLGAQWSLSISWIFIPMAMVCTFALVMLGAIGQRYSTIAFGTLVVSVYTCLTYSPEDSWYGNPLMILAGALLYGLVSIIVHLCFPNRLVQENLAKAYEALSAYLQAKSEFFDPDDDNLSAKQLALAKANQQVMQAFDQTRISLFYRLQGHHRHVKTRRLLRYYFIAQNVLERASSSHYQYHELFQQLGKSDLMFRFQRVMELQAIACQRIASSLRHSEHYLHSARNEKALQGLLNSLNYHQEQGLTDAHRWLSIAENLRNIEGQLSQIEQQTAVDDLRKDFAKSARLSAENVSGLRNMLSAIKNQFTLSSQLFRHALRLSFVVLACNSIMLMLDLDNKGFWIFLTAIFVCQPNYSATKKRLIQRIIGTVLGVFVGFCFQYFSPSLEAQLGLITLTGSLYYFFRVSNYGSSTFFITLLVFVSLDVAGLSGQNALLPRLFDTLTGTAIAWFAVSFIYPDWKYLNLHQNLYNTLQASNQYLRHILAQLQFGYNDQLAYRVARRDVHNHISALSAVISNMHSEPKKYRNALHFAPKLLGVTYTLLGYISALGAYREESNKLDHHIDFSAVFFKQGKDVIDLLDGIINAKLNQEELHQKIQQIDEVLYGFELVHKDSNFRISLVLIQQLRMIIQLLPQLQMLTLEEKHYTAQITH